jgi:hypothetical protein
MRTHNPSKHSGSRTTPQTARQLEPATSRHNHSNSLEGLR